MCIHMRVRSINNITKTVKPRKQQNETLNIMTKIIPNPEFYPQQNMVKELTKQLP